MKPVNQTTSLYNKYRPQAFKDLVGQDIIKEILVNAIKSHKVDRAHIFSGPRGTGKTSCARIFAKAVNCLNFRNDICNKCVNCGKIDENQTNDLIELDGASNNGVEAIRQLVDNAYYLPADLKIKVFIIDEAHMLTTNAWNALLKIVEEPPQHVMFIFSTTEFNKIIPTIQSRCMKHYFFLMDQPLLVQQINQVCEREKCAIEPAAAAKLAQLADGSLRDCLSLLSQIIIFSNHNISLKKVEEALFLVDQATKIKILKHLFAADLNQTLTLIEQLHHEGYQLHSFLHEINALLVDLWVYATTNQSSYLTQLSLAELQSLKFTHVPLADWIEILEHAEQQLRRDKNNFLTIKIALLKLFNSFNKVPIAQPNYSPIQPINPTVNSSPKLNQPVSTNSATDPFAQANFRQQQTQSTTKPPAELPPLAEPDFSPVQPSYEETAGIEPTQSLSPYQLNPDTFKTKTLFVNKPEIFESLKNTVPTQTIKPDPLPAPVEVFDFANEPVDFRSEENLILWTLNNLDKNLSTQLIAKTNELLTTAEVDGDLVWLKNSFSELVKNKFAILAAPTGILLCFDNLISSRKFNKQAKTEQYLTILNNFFNTQAYWISVHFPKLNDWTKMRKLKSTIPVPVYQPDAPQKTLDSFLSEIKLKTE
ncbi:DNA polymerase-3 subunit gamma/tau [Mycoplasmoides fastidiosum]|uniref:DNA polymerase III subunit gamma/tau n=1 Tax=Mycoplasmoides fastidiosum TaxID=92758 RepID=A0ABU0M040_9BACT|nr:DNA polymerase III subunit gamma/tau [Mycoplasmoides fastidiosum]MDQ0514317.1 DNA polymerase-3 subunit gamma/tau [Mycoplasmoides fastidiosum]UUD38080.1 DNA polymerase III subunit gamma/tau [Mycoplasmoides fastidiosum]